ncbi:hypothetical protein [Streptomyces sp. NPDC051546]|uniref:hypothetical protein n=1 Tax=Streptomyces sp. NPDC051546 TaxID=3365655 RepID=UPI0037B840FE
MKWKTKWREVLVPHELDGRTNTVKSKVMDREPVLPRDWDVIALKAVAGLVLAVTLVTVVWSTASIGKLLHGGVGFAAASMFDVAWAAVLILEWMARFDPDKRLFARVVGWILVAITMGALAWEGIESGSHAMAVVGASVSLIAKILWLAVFRHIDRDLSDEDQQWVKAEMSRASAMLAVASVRRQVARAENHAALEILAAERDRQEMSVLSAPAEPVPVVPESVPALAERPADWAELETLRAELATANAVLAALTAEPVPAVPVTPERDAAERDEEMLALYRAVQSTPGATEADRDWAAELAEIAARREPVARPADAPMLVKSAAVEPVAPGGEPVDRVPEQRPASMAAGMRELVAAGITDPEVQVARLAVALGREVSMDAVKRENRRIVQAQREAAEKAAAQDAEPLTGQYL